MRSRVISDTDVVIRVISDTDVVRLVHTPSKLPRFSFTSLILFEFTSIVSLFNNTLSDAKVIAVIHVSKVFLSSYIASVFIFTSSKSCSLFSIVYKFIR